MPFLIRAWKDVVLVYNYCKVKVPDVFVEKFVALLPDELFHYSNRLVEVESKERVDAFFSISF